MRRAVTRVLGVVLVVLLLVSVALAAGVMREQDATRDQLAGAQVRLAPDLSAAPRLADGELWFAEMDVTGAHALTSQARLQDVRMTATGVLMGADGMRAGAMTVDALVPFAVVAEQVGPGVTVSAAGDDEARVIRTVEVLGQPVHLSATGTVTADGGRVLVEPTAVEVGAPAWLEQALGDAARRLVTVRHELTGLPEDLELRRVTVVSEGFAVHLSGRDVDLGG
jgi:hypothetical protein